MRNLILLFTLKSIVAKLCCTHNRTTDGKFNFRDWFCMISLDLLWLYFKHRCVMDVKNVTYLELQKTEPNPHLLPRQAFYNCYSKNMSSMSWSRELFSISIINMWQSDEGSLLYFMYFILVSTNFYKFCGHCVSYNRNTFTRTLPLYITMFFSFSITVCNCNWCKCVLSSQQKEKRKGALKSNKVLYTTPYFGARKLTTK